MAKKDYYSILEIDHTATQKAVKTAYRQMALKYHPDHNQHNSRAADRFKLIQEAYEILSNTSSRQTYDSTYAPTKTQEQNTRSTTKSNASVPKKNLRYNVFITLEDIIKGCEKTIRYLRNVNGEKEATQLKVKIPKGAFNQQRLKVADYGTNNGDLFVIIHIQNHQIYQTDGLDVSVNVPINYLQAAQGAIIEVPTLSGIRKIKLRSCEFNNINFTLNNLGLPDLKTGERGNFHIHCFIENPGRLNPEQKNTVQKVLSSWPQGDMMQEYQSYLNNVRRS